MEPNEVIKTEGAPSVGTNRGNGRLRPSTLKGPGKASPKSLEAPNSKRKKTAWRKKHFRAPRRERSDTISSEEEISR